MKRTSSYTSCMHTPVRYYIYEPKVILRIKGIIQLHHGLSEHADRYDHFASFLSNQGFVVIVSDFMGHGRSLIDFEQGYFGDENGPENLIKDMHRLQLIVRRSYPDAPYFMLGVDLGSVLIRKYVSEYGDFVDGILLLGTMTTINKKWLKKVYLSFLRKIKGPMYHSQAYFRNFYSTYNKQLGKSQSLIDWLTSDEVEKNKYLNDPMTHFAYTVQGYRDILHTISEVNSYELIKKIPTYLSIYIGVGRNDPFYRGMDKLIEKYKQIGVKDLTYQVFDHMRHFLLFEKEKKVVYQNIVDWLNERTYL